MACRETIESQARLRYADILLRKGMQEEAREVLRQTVREEPSCTGALYLLAVLRGEDGFPGEAADLLQQALILDPGDARYLSALGVALQELGRPEEALTRYREALAREPRFEQARVNLALLLKREGRLSDSERVLAEGMTLDPESVRLRYNLANVLHHQGRSLDATAAYREVLRLDPEHLDARQNLLFALHYSPQFSDRQIFAEHLRAARRRAFRPLPSAGEKPRSRRGGRIRIGYLSPDFREHAVASFIEPVLREHDRERFEIFCYANVSRPDLTTERLKGMSVKWRDIFGVPDEAAAGMIEADGIDILIDLAGHTSGNRLPLFARRPAPLQLTWIGYPDTTGLQAIDYRITDRFADPPGRERYHSERLIRLPRSFCCYLPPEDAPELAPPPCERSGRITFGSFNNLSKVTPEVIGLWSRVLRAVPGSGFLIKGRPLADRQVSGRIIGLFESFGIEPGRIEINGGEPSMREHLAQYHRVDIALDTFPYNGTTTTCEALWMGVPVVTLSGTRHASRTGASILANCGLTDLVASDGDGYLEIARRVAGDVEMLRDFREGARERLAESPLLDAAGITRELEEALEGL